MTFIFVLGINISFMLESFVLTLIIVHLFVVNAAQLEIREVDSAEDQDEEISVSISWLQQFVN